METTTRESGISWALGDSVIEHGEHVELLVSSLEELVERLSLSLSRQRWCRVDELTFSPGRI